MDSRYKTGGIIALIAAFMVSLGINIIDTDEGYLPYTCDKETVQDMFCYKLSRVNDNGIQRNCYYDRDNSRKYKVCSTGWKRIINIDEISELSCPECEVCPPCICQEDYICDCPQCENNTEVVYVGGGGSGGGGGGGDCPECPELSCPQCSIDCPEIDIGATECELIIAYTDSGKYFCDGVGSEATCLSEDLVAVPYCII